MKQLLLTFITVFTFVSHVNAIHSSQAIKYARNYEYEKSAIYWDSAYQDWPHFFYSAFNILTRDAISGKDYAVGALEYYHSYSAAFVKEVRFQQILVDYYTSTDENKFQTASEVFKTFNNYNDSTFTGAYYLCAIYNDVILSYPIDSTIKSNWINVIRKVNQTSIKNRSWLNSSVLISEYVNQWINYLEFENNQRDITPLFNHYFSQSDYYDLELFNYNLPENRTTLNDIKRNYLSESIKIKPTLIAHAYSLVAANPSEKNLDWLIELPNIENNFEINWMKAIDLTWDSFKPDQSINAFAKTNNPDNKWLVIDVWGTWCAPCRKELPAWQEFYENCQNKESNTQFITLERGSKDLNEFMSENKYSFPVLSITEDQRKALGITSYPTTFLISPSGKYFILSSTKKLGQINMLTHPLSIL